MYSAEKHLSPEQVEWLINGKGSDAVGAAPVEFWNDAHQHLAQCTACEKLVHLHGEIEKRLDGLKGQPARPSGEDCPDQRVWWEVAAGILPETESKKLMEHAIQCDHCSPLLKAATEDLVPDVMPSEEKFIQDLRSARPEWQEALARGTFLRSVPTRQSVETSRAISNPKSRFGALPVWAIRSLYAAAAFAIVIGAFAMFRTRKLSVDELLATAYSEQRILELRIPGASHAPLRIQRGASQSRFDKPAALLEAEARIAKNLSQTDATPLWLEEKGRSDLLEGNYRSAKQELHQSLDLQPQSTSALTDLASAYFLSAESENRPIDYGNAIEYLSKTLSKSPDDLIALFNRAIVYERIFLYDEAVRDWEHYLKLDSVGPWADEARQRLQDLRSKLQLHQQAAGAKLFDPSQFIAVAQEQPMPPEIDAQIEEYQRVALTAWLPTAYREPSGSDRGRGSKDALSALQILRRILEEEHHDDWLSDLISTTTSYSFRLGLTKLAISMNLNTTGKYEDALLAAKSAQEFFSAAKSPSGTARALVEELYSLHRTARGHECLVAAGSLQKLIAKSDYRWIRTQAQLEESSCRGMMDDLGGAIRAAKQAEHFAEAGSYKSLNLRAISYEGSLERLNGWYAESWSKNLSALATYWHAPFTPTRAYNVYDDLDLMAESRGEYFLSQAFAQQAVDTISGSGNILAEAIARNRLARTSFRLNYFADAQRQFQKSQKLFEQLPKDRAITPYLLDCEIGLAKIQAQTGDVQVSLRRLDDMKALLDGIDNYPLLLSYYRTFGELHNRAGNFSQANALFVQAADVGNRGLHSLKNERDRLAWMNEMTPVYSDLVALRLRLNPDGIDALNLWEEFLTAATPDHLSSTTWMDTHSKLRSIPLRDLDHETEVSFAELPNGLAAWVFDDRGVFVTLVNVKPDLLNQSVHRFHDMCATPNSNIASLRIESRKLYDWLIAPLLSRLQPNRNLAIELTGALSDLPVAALVDGSGNYLGQNFHIVISPGFLYRRNLNRDLPVPTWQNALVVGVSSTRRNGVELSRLVDVESEAEYVASLFPNANLLESAGATSERILADLTNANVFHFAGHAMETQNGIALLLSSTGKSRDEATSSTITTAAISKSKLRKSQLVVLSACATAESSETGLSDPDSLVRAFLRAGTPHVVASRWDVDSVNTRIFMKAFYQSILSGKNVPKSVEEAAQSLRDDPKTSHPYYWAAFSSFGST